MKTYAMFTNKGDSAVAKIVSAAKTADLSWTTVETMLMVLAKDARYAEATDTEVRETVYCELFGA